MIVRICSHQCNWQAAIVIALYLASAVVALNRGALAQELAALPQTQQAAPASNPSEPAKPPERTGRKSLAATADAAVWG